MNQSNRQILDSFVLVRLLDTPKTGLLASKLRSDLKPIFEPSSGDVELSARIDAVLDRLNARGALESARKGNSVKYWPSEAGRSEALGFLGVEQLPEKTTWNKLKNAYLPAKALGISPSDAAAFKRVSTANGLAAAVARKVHGLPLPAAPTMKQVEDALCWRQLGVETDKAFTVSAVKRLLMNRALDAGRDFDLPQVRKQLAAKAVKAKRSDVGELRRALLAGFVAGAPEEAPLQSGYNRGEKPDLETFAERVLDLVRSMKDKRYGPDKVFICHVFEAYQQRFADLAMSYDEFKRKLVESNRRRLLDLARADIASTWYPDEVRRSATTHMAQTFHFVALPHGERA